jgi:carbon-monoxide dehydrogenase medium subunit
MKPARFDYQAPTELREALDLLAEYGDDGKVLAGGQSLVPALNLRLAEAEMIVDINRIASLDFLQRSNDELAVGALVRHAAFERPVTGTPLDHLLGRIAPHVGHPPIRTRGTLVGSLAHADPAAEWCAAAVALDARMCVKSSSGERWVDAADFFDGPFSTLLEPQEILTEARFPLLDGWGTGFTEHARTAGDFALVAVACALRIARDEVADARIAIAGAEGMVRRSHEAEAVLVGTTRDAESFEAAGDAVAASLHPMNDRQASADYRAHLAGVLTRRALTQAAGDVPR